MGRIERIDVAIEKPRRRSVVETAMLELGLFEKLRGELRDLTVRRRSGDFQRRVHRPDRRGSNESDAERGDNGDGTSERFDVHRMMERWRGLTARTSSTTPVSPSFRRHYICERMRLARDRPWTPSPFAISSRAENYCHPVLTRFSESERFSAAPLSGLPCPRANRPMGTKLPQKSNQTILWHYEAVIGARDVWR